MISSFLRSVTRCLLGSSVAPQANLNRTTRSVVPTGGRVARHERLCRGGEKVDEQLVNAFSLVVVHPVRGVGQALYAVEIGHVVVMWLGEVRAEV